MSQSPTDQASLDPSRQYLAAWGQLADKIQQGWSFSGQERNCCFLNTGQQRFADVSAAVGFDLPDDSRALATVDWDHDGDLDLWLTNRTSPRVRFLQNNLSPGHHFLAIRLQGDPTKKCNRDAIGARVEVQLAGQRLVKTLYAGDGFLSQSTKWIHFGLGSHEKIDSLVVRWPGSTVPETFLGLLPDRHYQLVQGTGKPQVWKVPLRTVDLKPSSPQPLPLSDQGRVPLATALPMPELSYLNPQGKQISVSYQGPLLINLWASWCQPCLAELREMGREKQKLRDAGLNVLALRVDELAPIDSASTAENQSSAAILKKLGFDFSHGHATKELVASLEELLAKVIYRKRQLPLPCSFLIGKDRRLIVIYKGPLEVEQLLTDLRDLENPRDDSLVRDRAVPFPGRWSDPLFVTHTIAIAETYLEGGYPSDAQEYLEKFLAGHPVPPNNAIGRQAQLRRRQLSDVHRLLGKIHQSQGDSTSAGESFKQALNMVPGDLRLMTLLGVLRMQQGKTQAAIDHYRQALKQNPNWGPAANNLAWILATHPEAKFRNAQEALRLAEQVSRATNYQRPSTLDTLAAAQAEAGRFAEAVKTTTQGISLANKQKKTELSQQMQARLSLYKLSKPFREKQNLDSEN